jgi:hypothetical protein
VPGGDLDDLEKILDPTGTRTPTPRSSRAEAKKETTKEKTEEEEKKKKKKWKRSGLKRKTWGKAN